MIVEPDVKGPATPETEVDSRPSTPAPGAPTRRGAPAPPRRGPIWRQRRVLLGGLGVLVVATIGVVAMSSRSATPAPVVAPALAPLVAHGQVVPVQQARVGTLGGGQVQQLEANLGSEVSAQTPLAWVIGPSGTEVVTAPFSGSVTNVLVHAGDTLMPGATIAVVANLHSLQMETSDVDEFLVGHVSVGQRVEVTVDALDNLALSGIVTNVALLPQTSTSGSQAYPVIVSLSSVPPSVHAGMSARITLPQ